MKKRWVAVLLTLCMALTLLPYGAAAVDFQDVDAGAYYYDAVTWAVNHDPQITNGTSPTTFSPDNTCKRCEVVTFLWRAFGAEKMTGDNPFTDVKSTDYYYDAVLWAVGNGVTNGTDPTHFSPENPCTREQVATFLWRALGKPASTMQCSQFADVQDKERYSFTPILWAFENGVTNGMRKNAFVPENPCTRAQIVTFLYRALANPLPPVETDGRLHFQPKVASQYLVEIFGADKVEAWFNLVDAVMAGEDTFACPDQETYDWIMGHFADKCCPVLVDVVDFSPAHQYAVVNGVARFDYLVSHEEAMQKIADFAALVEGILNETMQPDYSDFEKATTLFFYFQDTYTYDYAAADDADEYGTIDYVSAYRLLTGKTGICGEISNAYSYLLTLSGVNATTVLGWDSQGELYHEWSLIRLNGKHYHIDPTFELNAGDGEFRYFLMSDAGRLDNGDFPSKYFTYCDVYSRSHPHPDYTANDDTFNELRWNFFDSLDHENQILHYSYYNDFAELVQGEFDYSAF